MKIHDKTEHKRVATIHFAAHEVRELLVDAALAALKIEQRRSYPVIAKLKVEQEKEGSPSYPVERWTARVDVEIDLSPVAADEAAP